MNISRRDIITVLMELITVVIFQAREWPLSVTAEVVIAVVQDGTFALKVIKQLTPCMQGTL